MARTPVHVLVYVCGICLLSLDYVASQTRDEDDAKLAGTSASPFGTNTIAEKQLGGKECGFILAEPNVIEAINGYFEAGTKLLRYNIEFNGKTGTSLNSTNGSLFHPTKWSLTNSPAGTSLLLLKDYFNAMSLQTLGYGTGSVVVKLNQTPSDCLTKMADPGNDLELLLRRGILGSFGNPDQKLSSGIRACSRHVENTTINVGWFMYRCCDVTLTGKLQCSDVEETIWLILLFNIIHVLKLLVILFSPLLIPQSMYRLASAFIDYTYKAGDTTPLTFNVIRLNPHTNRGEGYKQATLHWFSKLTYFKSRIKEMLPGKTYKVKVDEVKLRVKASKILPSGYVPVGIFTFLRKFLCRCGMRKEVPATAPCCNADMFSYCPCTRTIPWYRCGTQLASIIFPCFLLLPWIIRVVFYYTVEGEVVALKRSAMIRRHLVLTSTGSLTTDLSPVSTIFLAAYIMVPVQAVLYSLVPRNVRRKLKYTIRECFRNTRATKASDICTDFTLYLCTPFTHFGIVGCLFLPLIIGILFPILLVVFMLRSFPIIGLSFRLLFNCVYYMLKVIYPHAICKPPNAEENSTLLLFSKTIHTVFGDVIIEDSEKVNKRRNKLIYAYSLAACFVTMWLLILIVSECLSFYVECAVYTLVGIILNSRSVMKHVTLVLIILYYGYDCASSVYNIYLCFNKTINKQIQERVNEDDLKKVAEMSSDVQPNTAFTLNREDRKLGFYVGNYGFLKCSIKSLLLFLNREDVPLIPRKFLMHIAEKSHFACPKKPHVLYLRAFLDFLSILFFLMFVFIVVFAFGQANNVSSANQALAALGGGFIPLVFRKFLFKSHDGPSLDTGNLSWVTTFNDAVKDCTCLWDVEDIIVESFEEIGDGNKGLGELTYANEDATDAEMNLLKLIEPNMEGVDLKVRLGDERGTENITIYVKENVGERINDYSRIEKLEDTEV